MTKRHAGRLTERWLAVSTDRTTQYSAVPWSSSQNHALHARSPLCVAKSEIAHTHLTSIVPEVVSKAKEVSLRLGRSSPSPDHSSSAKEKHAFLKHAKTFRQAGIGCDDHLTRLPQQERQFQKTSKH